MYSVATRIAALGCWGGPLDPSLVTRKIRAALGACRLGHWATPLGAAGRVARRFGPRRGIPGGGAHPRAVAGHLLAGLELASQLPEPPDAIVTPHGSGGTAAGLLLAVSVLGWPTRVIAARVAPLVVANRWRVAALARGTTRLLAARGIPALLPLPGPGSLPPVVVNAIGDGYGYPSAAGEAARALT